MSQWQWGQPGYQYPAQTGIPGVQPQLQFNQPGHQLNPTPQFQQQQSGFGSQPGALGFGNIVPQPTGFPAARPQVLQQTGFPGASLLQAQSSFQQRPPPPPVPPLPPSYQQNAPPPPPPVSQQQPSVLNVSQARLGVPSASSFGAPSLLSQPTGVGLLPQPTGFAGRNPSPLVPQVTGFVDPRLQLLSTSFMPASTSGGALQLASLPQQFNGLSLQQTFQQHNQAHGRGTTPKVPWALSKAEKKQYDQIFRAWDAQGTGFIDGQRAQEVFGQSGLDRNDLARIWTLADADNRGKLNLAEFHVAMGLIYRRLNGNDIPDEVPPELVPPSSRDLDSSVNFLKDVLKNETRARSPSGLDTPVSRLKDRSFTSSSSFTQPGGRQDATVYVNDDTDISGGIYQSRKRHIDRSTVRSRADDASPATSDLSSIKAQLLNTQKMLDDTLANEQSSDALDRELEDVRYRITQLQDDLEYVSKGSRSIAKDEERRRLERQLVKLIHEEVPELEKKVEAREARREREKREWARDRDRRNDRSGRYAGDESGRYSPAPRFREEARPYSRGASRPDRDDRDDRDRSYRDDRDRIGDSDRERDSGLSIATRTPPPPPPTTTTTSQPAPPPPTRSPAPPTKKMTPAEHKAWIQAEAQRRLNERKQALGIASSASPPISSPTLDTTIEDRLAQEKKEAEEKARDAERQAEEREKQRREKLEAEMALKGGKSSSPTPTTTAAPVPAAQSVPKLIVKVAPPPPKPRPPPPPPRRVQTQVASTPTKTPTPSVPLAPPVATPVVPTPPAVVPTTTAPVPAEPEEDPEEVAIRAREDALRKRREERAARLRKLEEEEAEETRKAEAEYEARRRQSSATKSSPAATPVISTLSVPPPPPAPPAPASMAPESPTVQRGEPVEEEVPPPPAPPPPPPAPSASAPVGDKPSNNPFNRLIKEGGGPASAPPIASTKGNPFFRPPTAPPAPAPPKSPGIPPPVKPAYHTSTKDSDDDWDDVVENEDDSSDEELGTRGKRMDIAQTLFGNMFPSRPQSAGPAPSSGSPISPAAPAPPPPPPPLSAPPAPSAPFAPVAAPAPTGDRSALLSAIQGGARLRKAVTNDRSGAATSGRVIGDAAPPTHTTTRPPSPPAVPPAAFTTSPPAEPALPTGQAVSFGHVKHESVDWYGALAADVDKQEVHRLPATAEEDEGEEAEASIHPTIQVSEHVPDGESELMADVDVSTEYRVRSLYPYSAQRSEDLDFDTNTLIVAHPSKSGGDWWYGTTVKGGKTGFFPQTFVQQVEQVHATALYDYAGGNADELTFSEGDSLVVVDRSETDWWKAERDGFVFVVPAAYLEVAES